MRRNLIVASEVVIITLSAHLVCGPVFGITDCLTPSEDSWIHGLNDTTPRGDSDRLSICPSAGYWIYLKFDLSGIEGMITGAELRLSRTSGSRPQEISGYWIADDEWEEGTLTGANRPEPKNPDNGAAIMIGEEAGLDDRWSSWDLLEIVQAEKEGDGALSLMLREDPSDTIDVRHYLSEEADISESRKPRLILTSVTEETIAPGWENFDVGVGIKPSFDFDSQGTPHVMGMTEAFGGIVWYASGENRLTEWTPRTLVEGYFYGPGDLVVDRAGVVHLAWHDHDAEDPTHSAISVTGEVTHYPIMTPDHDGWDNALALDSAGHLHQSSINPSGFGSQNSLQYGVYDGEGWTYEHQIEGSGPAMYGLNTSIAVDRMGRPHIVYCQTSGFTANGDLIYAFKNGEDWAYSIIVTDGVRGRFPSIALDHWDRPHVAWLDIDSPTDTTQGVVRYAVFNSGMWDIEEVGTLSNIELSHFGARKSVSLALDSEFLPHIAYADRSVMRYARRVLGNWETDTLVQFPQHHNKGLVVLRLDPEDKPGVVFWTTQEDPGLVRLLLPENLGGSPQADLNGDGHIGPSDLFIFQADWGDVSGPAGTR